MKRGLWILIAALLIGIAGFLFTRKPCLCAMDGQITARGGDSQLPELDWFRRELKLTDEQFTKVSALHRAYRPIRESLCAKILASHEDVRKIVDSGAAMSPELRAALQEHADLHVECQASMLTHLYKTAACMSPEQAKQYLGAMLPVVIELPLEPGTSSHGH